MASGVAFVKVCVVGLWHLGTVTAACLASRGHEVVGYDANAETTSRLQKGEPPISEPGLPQLVSDAITAGKLRFTSDAAGALRDAEVVWVAFDTPVDDEDRADVDFVIRSVEQLLPLMRRDTLVLISSQMPVGSTRTLEHAAATASRPDLSFAYSPENLRLGKAIEVFTNPDRVVVGVREQSDRARIEQLLAPFTIRIEWMSVESAEMTKHALNAFLATSVAFINEIATICEHVGADAKEVERGLKSEKRIGPGAYLGPGGAFAGGTLARDVVFLSATGRKAGVPTNLIDGIKSSNDAHRGWAKRRLQELLGELRGQRIAVWGLTYKPGTDTLRRSSAVELCRALAQAGAKVIAHDPAVKALPPDLAGICLVPDPLAAVKDAAALVVMTEWPEYRQIDGTAIAEAMSRRLVLDANRFLAKQLGDNPQITYATVGKAV
ncbi:MAG TPA: nucleotide sugar dehydrogenase [Thermoanaerobaculia bacterium]|nr:nucleotide sugar dehydrogenase [Thermoanaerobaculia bacterium]